MMQQPTLNPRSSPGLANATWQLSQRHWKLVLIGMLALLHVAVVRGVADPWARGLLLAHLGLLLLWQPFLRGEQRVSAAQGFVLSIGALAVMLHLGWWLLAFWVVVLAGLVGGKVYQHQARWQRRSYLAVFVYLVALLAVVILPEIAPRREIAPEIRRGAELALPLVFALIALFPAEREAPESAQMIDFFYSVFLMLMLVVVILGSFTIMTLGGMRYVEALATTVLIAGGAVLLVALAWNPRGGFSGIGVFFSRYLFSIGLPLEKWLHFLAQLAQAESRPERFLAEAAGALARLPWVCGMHWRGASGAGEEGEKSPHVVGFGSEALNLQIYSRHKMSPALNWHLHLLALLLAHFYYAKLREEALQRTSYLQAVHETGALMTHDIKNLLQSLHVLTSAAARDDGRDPAEIQALLRRQLPAITARLSETLQKFERPDGNEEEQVAAEAWLASLARHYRAQGVSIDGSDVGPGLSVPRSLFDSVADNLIRNALSKRAADPSVAVRVSLSAGEKVRFAVRDTGKAVPADLAGRLLRTPVPSPGGLGIGLYQSARLAESQGFRLTLESNRDGEVCFMLGAADR
jgi:signal transduction histidine kinase